MSATAICTQDVSQTLRRTRKTHAKVKTGCTTCKIRRKKCDETKPQCIRCTSTGRRCDGYSHLSPASTVASTTSPSQATPASSLDHRSTESATGSLSLITPPRSPIHDFGHASAFIPRTPSAIVFKSGTDFHCFDFFRFNTGLQFQNYFDSSVWQDGAIKAAIMYPVVMKVATAVGAVHQRFNHGISRKAFEYCAIADRLHREAVQSLQVFVQEKGRDPNFNEVRMISCVLLSLYEGFQGNFLESTRYYDASLRAFWDRPVTVTHSDTRYRRYQMESDLFFSLREKYSRHSLNYFGSCPMYLAHRPSGDHLPHLPAFFNSLADARDSIFTEFDWLLHTPARLWHKEHERTRALNFHTNRMLRWSAAYAELQLSQPFSTPIQKCAGRLLKHVRDAIYLLLFVIFFVRPDNRDTDLGNIDFPQSFSPPDSTQETHTTENNDYLFERELEDETLYINLPIVWDLIAHFPNVSTNLCRLCMLADTTIESTSPFAYTSHSFSVDSGIGQPCVKSPTPATSSKTRHILRNLLQQSTTTTTTTLLADDTDTDTDAYISTKTNTSSNDDVDTTSETQQTKAIYRLAEMISSMEEHALRTAVRDLLPDIHDWKWIDVSCFIEERRLLVQYCRPDRLGERSRGLLWVQQWLEW